MQNRKKIDNGHSKFDISHILCMWCHDVKIVYGCICAVNYFTQSIVTFWQEFAGFVFFYFTTNAGFFYLNLISSVNSNVYSCLILKASILKASILNIRWLLIAAASEMTDKRFSRNIKYITNVLRMIVWYSGIIFRSYLRYQ